MSEKETAQDKAVREATTLLKEKLEEAENLIKERAWVIKPSSIQEVKDTPKTRIIKVDEQDPLAFQKMSLGLLESLTSLQETLVEWETENEDESTEPLGLVDQKNILNAIDFIVIFAITPLMLIGTGIPVQHRLKSDISPLAQVIVQDMLQQKNPSSSTSTSNNNIQNMDLAEWMIKLTKLALTGQKTVSDVGHQLRTRYMADMLSGLFIAAYTPLPNIKVIPNLSATTMSKYERSIKELELKQLLQTRDLSSIDMKRKMELRKLFSQYFNSADTFLAMESLVFLQSIAQASKPISGPLWYIKLCSKFLSRLVLRPHGVEVAISFLVNSEDNDSSGTGRDQSQLTAQKLDKTMNIILTPPSDIDANTYITNMCESLKNIFKRDSDRIYRNSDTNSADNNGKSIAGKDQNNDPTNDNEKERGERQCKASACIIAQLFNTREPLFVQNVVKPITQVLNKWRLHKSINKPNSESKKASQCLSDSSMQVDDSDSDMKLDGGLRLPGSSTTSIKPKGKSPLIQEIKSKDTKTATIMIDQKDILIPYKELRYIIYFLYLMSDEALVRNMVPEYQLLLKTLIGPIFVQLFHLYSFLWEKTKKQPQQQQNLVMKNQVARILDVYFEYSMDTQIIKSVKELVFTIRGEDFDDDSSSSPNQDTSFIVPVFDVVSEGGVILVWPSQQIIDSNAGTIKQEGNGEDEYEEQDKLQTKLNLNAFIDFISAKKYQQIAGQIFVLFLQEYTARWQLYIEPNKQSEANAVELMGGVVSTFTSESEQKKHVTKWWLVSQALMAMVDQIGPRILNKPLEILGAIETILEQIVANPPVDVDVDKMDIDKDDDKDPSLTSTTSLLENLKNVGATGGDGTGLNLDNINEEQLGDTETVLVVLTLLSVLLSEPPIPSSQPTSKPTTTSYSDKWDKRALDNLDRVCQHVKSIGKIYAKSQIVSGLSSEIIMQSRIFKTLASINNPDDHVEEKDMATGEDQDQNRKESLELYAQALRDIQDEAIPVKAHGLVLLRQMVLEKNPILTESTTPASATTSSTNMDINSATKLDDIMTIFARMIQNEDSFIYLNAIKGLASFVDAYGSKFLPKILEMYKDSSLSADTRLHVGEALLHIAQRSGLALAKYSDLIVPQLIDILNKTTINTSASAATTKQHQEQEVQDNINIIQSAISILGAMCEISPLSSHKWIDTIVRYISEILVMTANNTKLSVIRRAAIYFLVSLLKGHGSKLFERIDREMLSTIFDQLQTSLHTETDEIARYNASVGVHELENLIINKIFPKTKSTSTSSALNF
ncbi:hypothetical protein H4219_003865 [Mycoemilia scoparia]|uniref:RNA polymerase II assembly factor Rtp1 C-terminal domain-containing protein n=1 Tax=Mycoemilia scoparia TaxID=417184 RepID=A0A9W7ZTI1_9FUNG|nr:hypothetical protein H4219_003865 [Mycoemilia scoparia]